MKTYTFKIKYRAEISENEKGEMLKESYPTIVTCIHCPVEVFFDSVKATNELVDTMKNIVSVEASSELYVTVCDFVNSEGKYVDKDIVLCHISALLESSDLKEFFTHKNTYGVL